MIILKKGMSFGRIRFNQGKGVINPRLPQILLNIGFQTCIFYGFILPGNLVSQSALYNNTLFNVSRFFEKITQNVYSYESKSLLKKLCELYNSYLPFNGIGQEKQILREILVRKSHCVMIRGEFRTPSNISDEANIRYLSWEKPYHEF